MAGRVKPAGPVLSAAEKERRRIERLAQNPATRAAIPLDKLKGFAGADEMRAQRALNARLNAPVVEGSPMTGRDVTLESQALQTQRFGPEELALNQQVQQSQAQSQAIPGWFQEYRNAVAQARAETQQAYQAANDQFANLQQGTASPDAGGENAGRGAEIRQAMVGNQGGLLATQGASQQGLLSQQGLASYKGQMEALVREAATLNKVRDEQQGVAREKGAFDITSRQGILDREQRKVLEQAAFGLKEDALAADIEADQDAAAAKEEERRAKERERREEAAAEGQEVNEYGYTKKQWAAMSPTQRQKVIREQKQWGKSGRGKGGTSSSGDGGKDLGRPLQEPADSKTTRRTILSRAAFVDRYVQQKFNKPADQLNSRDRARVVQALRGTHAGFFKSPDQELALSASLDLAINGRISSANIRRLRKLGYFVTTTGDYWKGGNRGA